jgi:O-acetyl-ADP-ribose deacetylase (regulator of RNase III)
MKELHGNLISMALAGQFEVIIHGCNCFCTMGAGIAKAIRHHFPEAYAADLASKPGDQGKLGSYSAATVTREGRELTVVNAYSQYHFHGTEVLVDYQAVRRVFTAIAKDFSGKLIGYPKIGAGLAGGDWTVLAAIINQCLAGEDHTLVLLPR